MKNKVFIGIIWLLLIYGFQSIVNKKCTSGWLKDREPNCDNARRVLLLIDSALTNLPQGNDFESFNSYYLKYVKIIDIMVEPFLDFEIDHYKLTHIFEASIKEYAENQSFNTSAYKRNLEEQLKTFRNQVKNKIRR
jgi:hypothetical protein